MSAEERQGSIPTQCGEEFEVSSSGDSEEAARQSAQNKANKLCRRMKLGCDQGHEIGTGSYKESGGIYTYTSKYVCIDT